METIILQSPKYKVMSSISVFSVSLRKWKTLGTDLLDTSNKYHFVFSEVPSTHSASISENANGVFFCLFFSIYTYLKLKEDGTLCMMQKYQTEDISLGEKEAIRLQVWPAWVADLARLRDRGRARPFSQSCLLGAKSSARSASEGTAWVEKKNIY